MELFSGRGTVIMMGDFNARTARMSDIIVHDGIIQDISPWEYIEDVEGEIVARESPDKKVERFGRLLLELCQSSGLRIANGRLGQESGKFTCFKWNGQSVVDYALVDRMLFDGILFR